LPSNLCGGGGSWPPSIVVVALGKPGVPETCWAAEQSQPNSAATAMTETLVTHRFARIGGLPAMTLHALNRGGNAAADERRGTSNLCNPGARVGGECIPFIVEAGFFDASPWSDGEYRIASKGM
jgi:hypothetical protein